MEATDQLLDMLKTIDEAENFLRKRCASGLAGQSLGLFQDLSSLIELIGDRFMQTEYLPQRLPVFSNRADTLAAIAFLDQVDDWSREVRDRVHRQKMRRGLALGSIYDIAETEGKPFAAEARGLAGLFRPTGTQGTPEERASATPGVTISLSGGLTSASGGAQKMETPSEILSEVENLEKVISQTQERLPDFSARNESVRLFEAMSAREEQAPRPSRRGGRSPVRISQGSFVEERERSTPMAAVEKPPVPVPPPPERESPPPTETRREPGGSVRERRASRRNARTSETREQPHQERPQTTGGKPMESPTATPMESPTVKGEVTPLAKPMEPPPARAEEPEKPSSALEAETPLDRVPRRSRTRSPEGKTREQLSGPPRVIPGSGNAIDRDFAAIMDHVETMDEGELTQKLASGFSTLENRYKMVMIDILQRMPQQGRFVPDRNDFGVLRRRAAELVNHRLDFLWLYGKLGDFRSKKTLLAIVDNWFSFNVKDLANMKEKLFAPYLDVDLISCGGNEVFVDMGAYIGEVTKDFALLAGTWKQIYCYEIHEGSFSSLSQNLAAYPNVELRNKGIEERGGTSHVVTYSGDPAGAKLDPAGSGAIVETVSLDGDLKEPVTILKMCLNGGEQAAIRGCADHIHKDHPRLAIRGDYLLEDLWKIPRMIERLDPKYRFYLRHYGGNIVPTEFVLYGV